MNKNRISRMSLLFVSTSFLVTITFSAKAQTIDNGAPDSAYISEALQLIHSPEPTFQSPRNREVDPSALSDIGFEQVYPNVPRTFLVRDGDSLFAYQYPMKNSKTIVILLHGVLSSAYLMNKTAGLVQEATHAEIFALDFRGHGRSTGEPGDVDYIGQYEHDLADVISTIKKEKPGCKIILAAHSMGGGIALRYAIENDPPLVDGYLLFAPLLGHNSPTIPRVPTEAVQNKEAPFLKIHIPRIVGLKMLNAVGHHQYDSLPVLFFNLPEGAPIRDYSFRANESMAPADYKMGLAAVNKPLIVFVGTDDEAFVASEFEPAIRKYSSGEIYVIEGATHNGIRHEKEAMQRIKKWIRKYELNKL